MSNKEITVLKIVEHIDSHLNEDLDLTKIAEQAGYSKYHLERIFKQIMDCSIYKYIQIKRLTEAARMLVFSDMPIVDISFLAKYESQQAFSLAFKKLYHVAPKFYRNQIRLSSMPLSYIYNLNKLNSNYKEQIIKDQDIADGMITESSVKKVKSTKCSTKEVLAA